MIAAANIEHAIGLAVVRCPHLRAGEAFTATVLGVSLVGTPRLLSYIPPDQTDKIVLFN